jgi:Lrp/AsnC family leucine-responsive transcriptional regulator
MDLSLDKVLDKTGHKLVQLLQANARLSFSELGRQVGLSQPAAAERIKRLEEVLECHHVSGAESFYMKVAVSSTAHLEELIGRISKFGQTSTTVVLSTR